MAITRALAAYIDAVDVKLQPYVSHPCGRTGVDLKFAKYCAFRDLPPSDCAAVLYFTRSGQDVPTAYLWLAGAWDYICYNQ